MPVNPTTQRTRPAGPRVAGPSPAPGDRRTGFAWPLVWVRFAALPVGEIDRHAGLDDLWADRRVRDAVRLASPSLARNIERQVERGAPEDPRLYRGMRTYHARMAGRATPFGLMAGVFSARLSTEAGTAPRDLSIQCHVRSETGPAGPRGLGGGEVIGTSPGLEEVAGGYLVPPHGALRCPPDRATHVRDTPTMRRVAARLRTPMTVERAIGWLCAESDSPAADWSRYLERLVALHVLVRVEPIGARPRVTHTVVPPGAESHLDAIDEPALSRNGGGIPKVSVDAFGPAADGSAVPADIGGHATLLCDILDTVNPPARYPAHLGTMVAEFRRRFGPAAEVPLPDVFSLTGGIRGGLVPAGEPERARTTERDRILRRLLDAPGVDPLVTTLGQDSIDALAALTPPGDGPPRAPVQELLLRTFDSPAGLRSELAFAGPAAAFGGRFVHMLPPGSRTELVGQIEECDRLFAPYEVSELVLAPNSRSGRLAGVVPVDIPRGRRVSVAAGVDPTGADSIGATDVLVGVDRSDGRFYLRSRASGRRLHVVQSSMVRDSYLDPLEAFVLQVCHARFRYSRPLDWGGLARSEFLPGLRVGPVLVSSPRWLLRRDAVDADGTPAAGLRRWMRRWHLPYPFVARMVGSDGGVLVRGEGDDDILLRLLRQSRSGRLELAPGPRVWGSPFLTDADGAPHVTEVAVTVGIPPPERGFADTGRQTLVTCALLTELNRDWAAFEMTMPWPAVVPFLTDRLGQWVSRWAGNAAADRCWWEVAQRPEPLVRVCVPRVRADGELIAEDLWHWARRLRQRGELTGVAPCEHHVNAGMSDGPPGRTAAWEFLAADARHSLAVLTANPVTSRGFAVQAAAHVYRLAERSGVGRARLRESLRAAEGTAGGRLYRSIGAELNTVARAGAATAVTPELSRWYRALAGYVSRRPGLTDDDVALTVRQCLDRLCVTDVLRPHILGAARRLLDRHLNEERTPA